MKQRKQRKTPKAEHQAEHQAEHLFCWLQCNMSCSLSSFYCTAAGLLGAFFGIYDVEFFIRPIPQEWNIQSE